MEDGHLPCQRIKSCNVRPFVSAINGNAFDRAAGNGRLPAVLAAQVKQSCFRIEHAEKFIDAASTNGCDAKPGQFSRGGRALANCVYWQRSETIQFLARHAELCWH